MNFNKSVSKKGSQTAPTVVFRELKRLSSNRRFQGNISAGGMELICSVVGSIKGIEILYSDEHSFIGFRHCIDNRKYKNVFGATELFSSLSIEVGKHYELKVIDGVAVIDTNEFNRIE